MYDCGGNMFVCAWGILYVWYVCMMCVCGMSGVFLCLCVYVWCDVLVYLCVCGVSGVCGMHTLCVVCVHICEYVVVCVPVWSEVSCRSQLILSCHRGPRH